MAKTASRSQGSARTELVGVISDTHSLLRPEAVAALAGVDRIIHAGDIGDPAILEALSAIAPVHAVRGNNDRGKWADAIPVAEIVECAGAVIYALHDVHELDLDPAAAGFAAVIAGHSHKPLCEVRGSVLFFNPGSAGPRRFKLPITVGKLRIEGGIVNGEIVHLDV
jgi:hypothetical protein